MRYILLIALVATISVPVFAERFINFTDADGKSHKYELAEDRVVVVSRPDGSIEVGIKHENGELVQADTYRPDDSREAVIGYRNGKLWNATTYRPDGSIEAQVQYEDGELEQAATYRPDGSDEALIGYKNGELFVVCKSREECL